MTKVSHSKVSDKVSDCKVSESKFSDLLISAPLQAALAEEGYTIPTPIQLQAIPHALEGKDILGCAQTGTGKTAAFALPILHRLMTAAKDPAARGGALPRALILSPTRELATQISDSFATYGRHTGLSHACIYGGVSQFHQVRALHRGVDVLVATPGRLMDLMEQRLVNLSKVEVFVLDEADRMLDMGFIRPIQRIASAIPAKRQTMLFSATLPREIMHLAEALMKDPVRVSVARVTSAEPKIEQALYAVPRQRKQALLHHLLAEGKIVRAVVFTKTKHGADRVARKLHLAGVRAEAIHGNKAQNQRTRALDSFKAGRSRVLVATDVAARGLDVDGITHVFNFDLPMEPENYVHRIGRTGRAGASGFAVTFCDHEERDLLRAVEKFTGRRIPLLEVPNHLPEAPDPKGETDRYESSPRPRSEGRSFSSRMNHGSGGGARGGRGGGGGRSAPAARSGPVSGGNSGGMGAAASTNRGAGAGGNATGNNGNPGGQGPRPAAARPARHTNTRTGRGVRQPGQAGADNFW